MYGRVRFLCIAVAIRGLDPSGRCKAVFELTLACVMFSHIADRLTRLAADVQSFLKRVKKRVTNLSKQFRCLFRLALSASVVFSPSHQRFFKRNRAWATRPLFFCVNNGQKAFGLTRLLTQRRCVSVDDRQRLRSSAFLKRPKIHRPARSLHSTPIHFFGVGNDCCSSQF